MNFSIRPMNIYLRFLTGSYTMRYILRNIIRMVGWTGAGARLEAKIGSDSDGMAEKGQIKELFRR